MFANFGLELKDHQLVEFPPYHKVMAYCATGVFLFGLDFQTGRLMSTNLREVYKYLLHGGKNHSEKGFDPRGPERPIGEHYDINAPSMKDVEALIANSKLELDMGDREEIGGKEENSGGLTWDEVLERV
jgi:hypothetical protein